MERRRFIVRTSSALAGGGALLAGAPHVIAQPKFQWRMPTTWTPALDVMQGAAQRVARVVDEMTGGRLRIEVFPAGQLMPPLGCFDAASPPAERRGGARDPEAWGDGPRALA
jgi:TRAP-type mannitol/chloroaromatic compound transport system substrate-binding protein